MDFSQLLDGAEVLLFQGSAEIKGLDYDSRRVRRRWAFVAMRGKKKGAAACGPEKLQFCGLRQKSLPNAADEYQPKR
jgi:hypothetical protein